MQNLTFSMASIPFPAGANLMMGSYYPAKLKQTGHKDVSAFNEALWVLW